MTALSTYQVYLKGYLPIENVRLLDATICTLSNKTIIMPVRFFYEFKLILRDLSIYWRRGKKVTTSCFAVTRCNAR
jgi:hypothetical protein